MARKKAPATNEAKYVVKPLLKWLKNQKAQWKKLYKPRYGKSATGWDIEAQRKNQDLLIEAKYVDGPFLNSFSGLIAAPLAKRPQHFLKKKYRSWCYGVCWAIGCKGELLNLYQRMFDYFVRNVTFWRHYGKDLKMKYIFFIEDPKIIQISFSKFIELAEHYKKRVSLQTKLSEKRKIAEQIMLSYFV